MIRGVSTPTLTTARQIHLASRPSGWPTPENFALVEADIPGPAEGQVRVRNRYLSVDPYMRGRMNDVKSYLPPFRVGRVMEGAAVGDVVDSRSPALAVGETVLHFHGWRDYAVGDAAHFQRVDTRLAPVSAYLDVLGVPGQTVDNAGPSPGRELGTRHRLRRRRTCHSTGVWRHAANRARAAVRHPSGSGMTETRRTTRTQPWPE